MSNMIPCRLTGKPFRDIYVYQDPPLWETYIDAVKHFGFDGWIPVPVELDQDLEDPDSYAGWEEVIVRRTADRIYTRFCREENGGLRWHECCKVYYDDNPPTRDIRPTQAGLPDAAPSEWEPVVPRRRYQGVEPFHAARKAMGNQGVVGLAVGLPGINLKRPEEVYEYHDDREAARRRCAETASRIIRRAGELLSLEPDFLLIAISGFMICNPEPIFRDLALPTLKTLTRMCFEAEIPSQIHCCGPERDLVRIAAEETRLSSINPLELPPMGDCDLAELKQRYGHRISLMGNLHTTEVMLKGRVRDVETAAKAAIDAAGDNGGFILSTGDQCGRDTPDENIHAMIEVARTYGKY
jgi:uroporphyrinogen decarboxylase